MKLIGIKIKISRYDLDKLNLNKNIIANYDNYFGCCVVSVYSLSDVKIEDLLKELDIEYEVFETGMILNYYPANHLQY